MYILLSPVGIYNLYSIKIMTCSNINFINFKQIMSSISTAFFLSLFQRKCQNIINLSCDWNRRLICNIERII